MTQEELAKGIREGKGIQDNYGGNWKEVKD